MNERRLFSVALLALLLSFMEKPALADTPPDIKPPAFNSISWPSLITVKAGETFSIPFSAAGNGANLTNAAMLFDSDSNPRGTANENGSFTTFHPYCNWSNSPKLPLVKIISPQDREFFTCYVDIGIFPGIYYLKTASLSATTCEGTPEGIIRDQTCQQNLQQRNVYYRFSSDGKTLESSTAQPADLYSEGPVSPEIFLKKIPIIEVLPPDKFERVTIEKTEVLSSGRLAVDRMIRLTYEAKPLGLRCTYESNSVTVSAAQVVNDQVLLREFKNLDDVELRVKCQSGPQYVVEWVDLISLEQFRLVAKEIEKVRSTQNAQVELAAKIQREWEALEKTGAKVATKKTTITCVKGKLTKKVTAVKPKCPAGYKLKK